MQSEYDANPSARNRRTPPHTAKVSADGWNAHHEVGKEQTVIAPRHVHIDPVAPSSPSTLLVEGVDPVWLTLARISAVLILFAVVSASAGCSRGTPITVINQSDVPLEDVVLSGSGFSENLGSVGPHADARVVVRPRGESDVRVQFKARGEALSFGPDGYFEAGGGYVVTITVSPGLTVSVKPERAY